MLLVSATPGVVCGALAADCAPILLADAEARVVAAAHAGWKGALGGMVEGAIGQMEQLGARRDRLRAVIGPCISPASYEVGLEFLEQFVAADPAYAAHFAPGATAAKRMFDLPGFVLGRLRAAGVGACEWIGRDTCAEGDLFFSNRHAFKQGEPDYGRLLSAIMLEPGARPPSEPAGKLYRRGRGLRQSRNGRGAGRAIPPLAAGIGSLRDRLARRRC